MHVNLPIFENISLKKHCTFGIGGPARFFTEVRSNLEMQQAILWCCKENSPYLVLGKGSNCLFSDQGYLGMVIHNKIEFMQQPTPGVFYVGAGYSFALLGVQAARNGWGGLEFASGIPASVGGAVYMNAGANGMETCQFLSSVDFINEKGDFENIPRSELNFSYRHSPFQLRKGAIVGATFILESKPEARKQQIEIVNKRKETQPYGSMSAGCIFLNPSCGHAGALIEKCGLKGFKIGGAQVSHVHANFLINAGEATCQDMQALIAHVKMHVKEKTGVQLQSEVRFIPYQREEG